MSAAKPRIQLPEDFLSAVRNSGIKQRELSRRAGFPGESDLSLLLCNAAVVLSPRTVARLQIVAKIVGFDGPIFTEEFPPVTRRDAFGPDELPEPRS